MNQQKEPTNAPPKHRRQPRYAVIIEDDDVHTFEYVISTLKKVFRYPVQRCEKIAEAIHAEGEANVWVGTFELAELKQLQIQNAGPDTYASKIVKFPLGVRLEPVD